MLSERVNLPPSVLQLEMWQVLLSNLLNWTQFCPRPFNLAESILLGSVCWVLGFVSGCIITLLLTSSKCRQVLCVVATEFLKPPATPVVESRLSGYRRP